MMILWIDDNNNDHNSNINNNDNNNNNNDDDNSIINTNDNANDNTDSNNNNLNITIHSDFSLKSTILKNLNMVCIALLYIVIILLDEISLTYTYLLKYIVIQICSDLSK